MLGRALDLCRAEFESISSFASLTRTTVFDRIAFADGPDDVSLSRLMNTAGGIIKAGSVIQRFDALDNEILLDALSTYISKNFSHYTKVSVGLSVYGTLSFSTRDILPELKKRFKSSGTSLRYILGDFKDLSSVQVEKQRLLDTDGVEFVIVSNESGIYLCRTAFVQPFEEWSDVDYGRPGRDPHSGMLPPKVARMMLTLGIGALERNAQLSREAAPFVFDPFCGSGTVLTEAMRLGMRVGGSDISPKAIEDTQHNVEWLLSRKNGFLLETILPFSAASSEEVKAEIFVSEVAHIERILGKNTVDLIVTETYLGPAFEQEPTPGKFERIVKGLEKLYIGAFKSMAQVLKPGGVLVFAEPEYYIYGKSFSVGIIDKAARFGYTLSSKPIVYKREKAFVGRKIGVLVKNK